MDLILGYFWLGVLALIIIYFVAFLQFLWRIPEKKNDEWDE